MNYITYFKTPVHKLFSRAYFGLAQTNYNYSEPYFNSTYTEPEYLDSSSDLYDQDLYDQDYSFLLNTRTQDKTANIETLKKTTSSLSNLSAEILGLIDLFKLEGINIEVTSGYRANATTKSGNISHHSRGTAIDVVPKDGDFVKLANDIKNNSTIRNYMRSHGLGVIDETTPQMLAKTGGTGKHFHIGPDRIALNFWNI